MLITISGKPCSGKSTIVKVLVDKYGFKKISVGDMFKAEAEKRGMSSEEFNAYCINDPAYDFFIDNETKRLGTELENEKVIFDSRLAWHFVPKYFKVFTTLNEDEMAQRLANSDRTGKEKITEIEEAKRSLINRFNLENERYKQIYGFNNLDMNNYDLVLDTSNRTPESLADELYENYLKYIEKSK